MDKKEIFIGWDNFIYPIKSEILEIKIEIDDPEDIDSDLEITALIR